MALQPWNDDSTSPELDLWLWRILQNDKNKAMISRLEDSLLAFLTDIHQTTLAFPPRPPFHRKVCYLVARRYGLAHRLEHHPDTPPGPAAVRLVLLKTSHSAAPSDRLAVLASRAPPEPPKHPVQKLPAPPEKPLPDEVPSDPVPSTSTTTTFLRRPRTADGKAGRVVRVVPGSTAAPAAAALKKISEEDYRKARARIFRSSDIAPLDPKEEQGATVPAATKLLPAAVVKVAKGPIEGSPGFERRRNRRNASIPVDKDKPDPSRKAIDPAKKGVQPQSRPARPRVPVDQTPIQPPTPSLQSGFVQPSSVAARRQNCNGDLQDPDFDRRYDKWAVRHAPAPQQVPVPVFSQLLYPYTVQTGSAPHLHPTVQGVAHQYQSLPSHQAPVGALMFQHLGQGIGGLAAEYAGRGISVQEHVGYAGEQFGVAHSREMSGLQHQAIPPPVVRKPSPAYGLDSTVDFPPLP